MLSLGNERYNEPMLLEVIPDLKRPLIDDREWGYIAEHHGALPAWVRSLPRDMLLRFLASGPAFSNSFRDNRLISSAGLFSRAGGSRDVVSTSESTRHYYLVLADRDFRNILLFDDDVTVLEESILLLEQSSHPVNAFLVPKHPSQ